MNAWKVATWNIGGCILGESHQIDGTPNLDYYEAFIRAKSPDILCLQEQHSYDNAKPSQAEGLARRLGYAHWHSQAYSVSHTEPGAYLSLGMLSRFPLSDIRYEQLPNPGLTATGPNGQPWVMFDKGLTAATCHIGDTAVRIVNFHGFPFHYFGGHAAEERFAPIWGEFAKLSSEQSESAPAFIAGDFNTDDLRSVLPSVFEQGYEDAFTSSTTPHELQQDHILYSRNWRLLNVGIFPTESDHHYCEAKFETI